MTTTDDTGEGSFAVAEVPDAVAEAALARAEAAESRTKPGWLDRFVWNALWKVVGVGLIVAVGLVVAFRVQDLLRMLVISVFFALAMVPAVKYMHERWGWKRGAAVGVIYAGLLLFVVLMVLVLIPGIVEFANQVGEQGDEWVAELNAWTEDSFGVTAIDESSAADAAGVTDEALEGWADQLLGLVSSGIGLIFNLATIALFTFYFAADYDRIERAIMSRMPPARQQVYGWVSDTALEQTGGYFYSRLLLMIINGTLFFIGMVLVGMPMLFALPLSVFEAFVSTFIPAVGTNIGAAVPILVTLAVQGLVAALILLAWTLIYQQIENYWLSPEAQRRDDGAQRRCGVRCGAGGGCHRGADGRVHVATRSGADHCGHQQPGQDLRGGLSLEAREHR